MGKANNTIASATTGILECGNTILNKESIRKYPSIVNAHINILYCVLVSRLIKLTIISDCKLVSLLVIQKYVKSGERKTYLDKGDLLPNR